MTYVADLATYPFDHGTPRLLAVGWLAATEEFTVGAVESSIIDRLTELAARQPVMRTRGLFRCPFCPADDRHQGIRTRPIAIVFEGERVVLGSAEIWVRGPSASFAAPDLIVHYVQAHGYLPPPQFLEAVRVGEPLTP